MLQARPAASTPVKQTAGFHGGGIQGSQQVLAQGFDGVGIHWDISQKQSGAFYADPTPLASPAGTPTGSRLHDPKELESMQQPRDQKAHQLGLVIQLQSLNRPGQIGQYRAPERLGNFILAVKAHQPVVLATHQYLSSQGAPDTLAAVLFQDKQVRQLQGIHAGQLTALDQQETGNKAV